jgi:hypothetical protein
MKITIASIAAAALVAGLIPLAATATTASWHDEEWVHAAPGIGTSSFRCGTDQGYASTAFGRFLSGELLGQNLDGIAELNGMNLDRAADGTLAVDPPDAIDLGSADPTDSYANPLAVSALGGIVGLDLTGLAVGLPIGSAGAVNQYAQVSGYGTGAGASGLVSDSGAVLVSADTPPDQLPQPATIGLSTLLPSVAGIADTRLQVGAVASSSSLDWCQALRSALWGDGSVTGVARDYGVASLGLQLNSPLLGDLVGEVNDAIPGIQTGIDSLVGTNGLISQTISSGILSSLVAGLGLGSVTGTVAIDGLDLEGSLGSLLTDPLSDGVVSVDLDAGTIDVDLAGLLGYGPGALDELAPNTELVLNATVLDPIVDRVGGLLDTWTTAVVNALTTAIEDATLTVDLSVVVSILTSALQIVRVDVGVAAPIGDLIDGGATFTVDTEVLGLVGVLNIALALLGTSVSAILSGLGGLATGLVLPVAGVITTAALDLVTDLGSTLAEVATPLTDALSLVVDALPDVLSVMVNVQPDQPGAPPGSSFVPASGDSSAQYAVSALRVGLADFLVPGDVAHVAFATSSVGPLTAP